MTNVVFSSSKEEFATVSVSNSMMELHDPYTVYHQVKAVEIAAFIAHKMKLRTEQIHKIITATYMHDIGKAGLPVSILAKPTRLTDIEYELIKAHVNIGVEVLSKVKFDVEVIRYIAEHHERLDGSGYPNQLKGDEISQGGRILAVADTVSALTAKRTYRNPVSTKEIKTILLNETPHKLCKEVVHAVLPYLKICKDSDPFKDNILELL